MYKGNTIGVVVPCYNEADNVGTVIETVPEYVDRTYVVDDHSSDETWEVIRAAADEANHDSDPKKNTRRVDGGEGEYTDSTFSRTVVPVRHEHNSGVGAAILTGYERARRDGVDVAAVMAGDGQMDPAILDRILDPVVKGRAGYAKGNRLGGREYVAEMPAVRLVGNALLTSLTRVASGYWRMSDPQNGYTAINLDVFDEIDTGSVHEDYGFCNDLLVRLNVADVRVADVTMHARYREEQSDIRYSEFAPKLSFLLARGFLWRLHASYLRAGHPLPVVLVIGTVSLLLGAIRAVSGRQENGDTDTDGTSVFPWGVVLTAFSLAIDYHRNADLVEKHNPPDDDRNSN